MGKVLIAIGLLKLVELVVGWGITCGLVWLVSLCFGWEFSLAIATGVWLIWTGLVVLFNKVSKK